MDKIKQQLIMKSLRRASYEWRPREDARKRAKVSHGKYTCKACTEIFWRRETELDHIEPVIPIGGFDTWDGVITRLFCDARLLDACALSRKEGAGQSMGRKLARVEYGVTATARQL